MYNIDNYEYIVIEKSIYIFEQEEEYIFKQVPTDIDLLLDGKYDSSQSIKLRDHTPKVLLKLGLKDLPMLMNSTHVLCNILSEEEAKNKKIYNKKYNYHKLGKKLFLDVIDELENPLAIYINKNKKDYIVIINLKDEDGNYIIVPIYVETVGNYNNVEIKTNKIKSIYGKKNLDNYIKKNISSGLLKEIFKKN